jgi:hypothetical protein
MIKLGSFDAGVERTELVRGVPLDEPVLECLAVALVGVFVGDS